MIRLRKEWLAVSNKIVILGGGYGGLTVAHELLEKELPRGTELMLIDRMPFQGLKTEYYALASGTISDIDIRVGYPDDERLRVKYGDVADVELERKLIHFADGEQLEYDKLIIALGCTDKYHNIPGAEQYSCSIQSFSSTRQTYYKVSDVRPYGHVTIVGGGLSGVEMASELRESRGDLNICILDRGPSILSAFPEKLQRFVREWFGEHHIKMLSHVSVSRLEPGIVYNQEVPIHSDATIWTAGIQPSPVVQRLNVPKDPQGRVLLNDYYQIPGYTEVFVVGDCASLKFSPSAQAAQAQGKQVADVLKAEWRGEKPRLESIKLRGVLGSLGKKSGFGVMGKKTVLMGKVPRALKSGVLWKSKRHFG
ncbi:NAD(P)/FAD-dependent oxidoreductase [Paenibacillus cymbidii]|uniref:NAD(P)/FAD-dependent oxidoreductase n=1 Tax=Paenibacillus cymbidii TaxID=1639034 RepID=UPI00108105C8|nr:FAD-dependent oxidoreductase [Paenibacillus cymbidii]